MRERERERAEVALCKMWRSGGAIQGLLTIRRVRTFKAAQCFWRTLSSLFSLSFLSALTPEKIDCTKDLRIYGVFFSMPTDLLCSFKDGPNVPRRTIDPISRYLRTPCPHPLFSHRHSYASMAEMKQHFFCYFCLLDFMIC